MYYPNVGGALEYLDYCKRIFRAEMIEENIWRPLDNPVGRRAFERLTLEQILARQGREQPKAFVKTLAAGDQLSRFISVDPEKKEKK